MWMLTNLDTDVGLIHVERRNIIDIVYRDMGVEGYNVSSENMN